MDREIFYACCNNIAVERDPLPVSRARLTLLEPVLFEWEVFEMAAPIQSPTKSAVHSLIWFINAEGERPAEIHKQIVAVYCNVMNRQNVTKWCREFSEGRTDVHDEQRSGRPSLISDRRQTSTYVSGIQKLVPRLSKCLDNAGDYVEK